MASRDANSADPERTRRVTNSALRRSGGARTCEIDFEPRSNFTERSVLLGWFRRGSPPFSDGHSPEIKLVGDHHFLHGEFVGGQVLIGQAEAVHHGWGPFRG